jgi:hypothetical protein
MLFMLARGTQAYRSMRYWLPQVCELGCSRPQPRVLGETPASAKPSECALNSPSLRQKLVPLTLWTCSTISTFHGTQSDGASRGRPGPQRRGAAGGTWSASFSATVRRRGSPVRRRRQCPPAVAAQGREHQAEAYRGATCRWTRRCCRNGGVQLIFHSHFKVVSKASYVLRISF